MYVAEALPSSVPPNFLALRPIRSVGPGLDPIVRPCEHDGSRRGILCWRKTCCRRVKTHGASRTLTGKWEEICPTGQVTYLPVTCLTGRAGLVVGNLSDLRTDTSLNTMSPVSLMFSSDEETSRRFGQVLQELELEVQHCPEIFAAVRKLTSHSFDVIVADWDEGLEAGFLLKTSRELKSNSGAFTIAIANSDAGAAARQVGAGADLVLGKPIVPDKAKYALLTCDEFLCHMKTWLPKLGLPAVEETSTRVVGSKSWPLPILDKPAPEPLPTRSAQPSSAMRGV